MKRHSFFSFLSVALIALAIVALTSTPARGATEAELKERFEKRYPQVRKLKDAGKIGETSAGLIEAVKDADRTDAEIGKVIDDENADRKELYELLAKKENTTPQLVAERNAQRNFKKARDGDWLKGADGNWFQK